MSNFKGNLLVTRKSPPRDTGGNSPDISSSETQTDDRRLLVIGAVSSIRVVRERDNSNFRSQSVHDAKTAFSKIHRNKNFFNFILLAFIPKANESMEGE